jgi:hypothetical protein
MDAARSADQPRKDRFYLVTQQEVESRKITIRAPTISSMQAESIENTCYTNATLPFRTYPVPSQIKIQMTTMEAPSQC